MGANFYLLKHLFRLFSLLACLSAGAQVVPDTLSAQSADTILSLPPQEEVQIKKGENSPAMLLEAPPYPNPKKAGLYSAILPGAGQLYNGQYWKIPIIYAAVGAAAYFVYFNTDQYQRYRSAYVSSLQGKTHEYAGMYDQAALKQLQDGYKRYLDMTYLFSVIGYTLQIIDAIVFAHLKNFDVSQDISLRMQPVAHPGRGAGIGLVFHLK